MSSQPPPLQHAHTASQPGGLSPWLALGITLAPLFVSLALPALTLDDGTVWSGAYLFCMGWLGVVIGQYGWLANIAWFLAIFCLLLRSRIPVIAFSVLALLLSLASFTVIGTEIPMDEAAVKKATPTAFGPALYVWLLALLTPAIIIFWVKPRKQRPPPPLP